MNKSEFRKIKETWDSIETIERLEQLAHDKALFFSADISSKRPVVNLFDPMGSGTNTRMIFNPAIDKIIFAALARYKEDLKAKMADLKISSTPRIYQCGLDEPSL